MDIKLKYDEMYALLKNISIRIDEYDELDIDGDSSGVYDVIPGVVCSSLRFKESRSSIKKLYELEQLIQQFRCERENFLESHPDINGCICETCPKSIRDVKTPYILDTFRMRFNVWRHVFDIDIRENICMCCETNKIQLSSSTDDVHCVYAGGRDTNGNRKVALVCTSCFDVMGHLTLKKYKESIK